MKLLAFELATEACSVALWDDGEVRERFEVAPRRHAELALPWADALLAEAGLAKSQLDAIAIGRGPGAFTGVRLAIAAAALGIAYGATVLFDIDQVGVLQTKGAILPTVSDAAALGSAGSQSTNQLVEILVVSPPSARISARASMNKKCVGFMGIDF